MGSRHILHFLHNFECGFSSPYTLVSWRLLVQDKPRSEYSEVVGNEHVQMDKLDNICIAARTPGLMKMGLMMNQEHHAPPNNPEMDIWAGGKLV